MKTVKKALCILLALVALFSLVSCRGQIIAGGGTSSNVNTDTDTDTDSSYTPPELNDDPTDDFTVILMANGEPYKPEIEMQVFWSDGFSVHSAPVDESGMAKIDGLDGDYRVTLSQVPSGYTYDPNTNIATNDQRNIVLNLRKLNFLSGGGTGLYDCYSFSKTGVYMATIDGPDDGIYFQYSPDRSGVYSIESWVDVTADNINPYVDVYYGSSEWKAYERTINDGGPIGSYTINFVHTVKIYSENISSAGQATYTFVVKADSKNNKYPINVTFAVEHRGEPESNRPGNAGQSGIAIPTYDFSAYNKEDHTYGDEYKIVGPEYQLSGTRTYVFDENRFKIWKKSDGGDDFYHLYDKEKYPETNGYGPVLYAYITEACRFIDVPFSKIEYRVNSSGQLGIVNSALSVDGLNYKHFIEGYTNLATKGDVYNGGSYYCSEDCTCHPGTSVGWACTSECTECKPTCRRIPKELIGNEGYQSIANDDGLVPVTEELRDFLYGYCFKEMFFYDGLGTIENKSFGGKQYQAVDTSGWLFACAYYEQK